MAATESHHHAPIAWERLSTAAPLPGPRSSHVLACVDAHLYLMYGELKPRVPVDDQGAVFRLDLATPGAEWERVSTATDEAGDADARPPPCIAPAAAAVGTAIYIYGGRTAVELSQGTLGDVYKLENTTMTWSRVWSRAAAADAESNGDGDATTETNAPAPRSYHAAASLGGKLYVFGGCGPAGRLNDLWAFDPSTRAWERMPDPPAASVPPRGGASLAADASGGGRLVVVGGFDGRTELADAHAFDVARREWCGGGASGAGDACASCSGAEPTLPARSVLGAAVHSSCAGGGSGGHGGGGGGGGGGRGGGEEGGGGSGGGGPCAHDGHVVAFGGECDPSSTRSHDTAGKFLGDVWCGDGRAGAWHRLELDGAGGGGAGGGGRPTPRGWFASTSVPGGGGLVLHGGLDASNERLDDCWRLRF